MTKAVVVKDPGQQKVNKAQVADRWQKKSASEKELHKMKASKMLNMAHLHPLLFRCSWYGPNCINFL